MNDGMPEFQLERRGGVDCRSRQIGVGGSAIPHRQPKKSWDGSRDAPLNRNVPASGGRGRLHKLQAGRCDPGAVREVYCAVSELSGGYSETFTARRYAGLNAVHLAQTVRRLLLKLLGLGHRRARQPIDRDTELLRPRLD